MKKLITLALIIVVTTFIQAQNNLVFNQALIVELVTGEEQTVPEGKVWKVESASDGPTRSFKVNGSTWYSSFNDAGRNLPAWFPAGTILTIEGSNNSKSLSILEFNVVAISSSGGGGSGGGDQGSGISNGSLPGDDYTDGDPITDGDGNTYETVEINGQTWTTTNLNVSTYRDGTPIPYISDFNEWNASSTGAYTYAGQDSEAGYGKLYNAAAIIGRHDIDGATANKILAPEGFHIPTTTEWSNLIYNYTNPTIFVWVNGNGTGNLNGYESDVASSFLKSQTSWDNNGNNESGLNLKNYPSIGSYVVNNNYNFYNVTDFGYTYFAVNQLVRYSVDEIWIQSVVVSDFTLDSVPAGCRNNGGNIGYTPGGLYVRLVKD